jgi:hypothetical protein
MESGENGKKRAETKNGLFTRGCSAVWKPEAIRGTVEKANLPLS